jgi:carboxyl-terminal processing protease
MDLDAAQIDISEEMIISSKIDLPKLGELHGSTITWTSKDPQVITNGGIVLHPTIGSDSVTVTLTAKLNYELETKNYDFEIEVAPISEIIISDSTSLPFSNVTSEFNVDSGHLMTYFGENSSIPYVDVQEFLQLLDGFLYYEDLELTYMNEIMTIAYEAEFDIEDEFGNIIDTETESFLMTIDFNLNTITVDQLGFFDYYVYETATEYGAGITYLDSYVEEGQSVTFELSPYRFDLVIHDGKYLFPFHIANLLFTGGSYYNVYFNGNNYTGIYAFPDPSDTVGSTEDGIAFNTIKTSSYNGLDIPADLIVATYDMLAFTLDYFFGLKEERGTVTHYDLLKPYNNTMLNGTTDGLSDGIFRFVTKTLDDLHSSHHFPGYYELKTTKFELTNIAQVGPSVRRWYETLWDVQEVLQTTYPTNTDNLPPNYRIIDGGKTAIIYLDGFHTATVEDPDGEDSNKYMRETLDSIFAESMNIENIVVDLSYNTGGNLGALLRVLGYMTEDPIEMSYLNPLDGSRVTYFAEIDTVAYTEINWFFLTSKVTFSAANLMASIGQQMGFATIIGTQSGGGASSIIPVVLPDGSFFHMSSLNVLSYREGNDIDGYTYYSIEHGITPDYVLEVEFIQTDTKIIEAINNILN